MLALIFLFLFQGAPVQSVHEAEKIRIKKVY